ncbi:MAG: SDR family oxidoreductase [Rhodocyclaceae bacterium]|nr:SDR family oxidoreductase [Rhodocyclaceae bacterium]
MQRLLIIGCGDVMRRALPWLTRHHRVYATVRSPEDAVAVRRLGAIPIRADLDRKAGLRRLAGIAQLVLHSAPPPPEGGSDSRTRRLLAALGSRGILPRQLSYISTTGVYGDCAGARIDETRKPRPRSSRGLRRLDAEQVLRDWGARTGVRVSILRAPGIYAEDRLPVARIARGEPVLRPEDDVQTNHIHAEDLAQIAALSLYRGRPNRIYNACDDTELAMGEWFDRVADAFGLPHPPRLSRQEAATLLSPMTLSFMGESRRIANLRLKQELRVRLLYPTVDAGLAGPTLDSRLSTLD